MPNHPSFNCCSLVTIIPIALQQQWEISRRYAMFATPIAYLIDEQGIIVEDVAVGTESVQELISKYRSKVPVDLEMMNR
jgi:hypothetical protein